MPDATPLPFSLGGVLTAMRTWPLRLDIGAQPDPDFTFRPSLSEYLGAIIASTGWQAATSVLSASLEAAGGKGSAQAVAEAAQRVAERTAVGLDRGARRSLGKLAFEAMQPELDELFAGYPALRKGAAHQATVASLSLATTEALTAAATRLKVPVEIAVQIPGLHFLIGPHEPSTGVTALELPYRLQLSPIENARWLHRDVPVVHHGRTELWHTRLTTSPLDTGTDRPAKVRALWSPDYPATIDEIVPRLEPDPKPFRMSLDPLDRQMLVKLMAGYGEMQPAPPRRSFRPRSSQAKRLHLSSLGGLLDVEGQWNPRPDEVDLEEWRHLASLGRDSYVRVVYAGFLCCFGHAASLVKVTERKFESLDGNRNHRVAPLRQRFFIVVRQRVRDYVPAEHEFHGHNFPITRVEILTKVTPDLKPPGVGSSALEDFDYPGRSVPRRQVFWPVVPTPSGTGVDFRFEVVATDIHGEQVSFNVPLLFVSELPNRVDATITDIRRCYNTKSPATRKQADLGGKTVCFAPPSPGDKGDPRLPTSAMTFGAGALVGSIRPLDPNFYPETASAVVGIRPLQKLLGQPDAVAQVTYPDVYKQHGFGEDDPSQNVGQLFLQLIGSAQPLAFGNGSNQAKSDALGALAAPQMQILGLSKVMGPVAGKPPADLSAAAAIEAALGNVVGNTFDPTDFFDGATILGGVKLSSILKTVTGLAGAEVPKLLSRELDGPDGWRPASTGPPSSRTPTR